MPPKKTLKVSLHVGKACAAALENKTSSAPSSQLYAVNKWIEKKALTEKFNLLPPDSEFTFRSVGESRIKDDHTVPVKLYCGETADYQTWAIIRKYNHKPAQVVFVNESRTGEMNIVANLEHMAFMYPFKVFKKVGPPNGMYQLRSFVAYLFLVNGHCASVFPKSGDKDLKFLLAAINRICREYQGKGIEQVPNLHRPGEDLSFVRSQKVLRNTTKQATQAYNDDMKTIISGVPILHVDAAVGDLESRLEHISVADLDAEPPVTANPKKRGREDDDDLYPRYMEVKRARDETVRQIDEGKEKRTKLSAQQAILAARLERQEEQLTELASRLSSEERLQWLVRRG